MNTQLRKTLIASAILALIGSPVWAAGDPTQTPAGAPQPEAGTQMEHPAVDTPAAATSGQDSTGAAQTESEAMSEHPALEKSDTAAADNPIYARTPDELKDAEVTDSAGQTVGTVDSVVADSGRDSAHVVISSSGDQRKVVVSLDELQSVGDKLQLGADAEALAAREDYMADKYVKLESDKPISEFSAFESAPDMTKPAIGSEKAPGSPQ